MVRVDLLLKNKVLVVLKDFLIPHILILVGSKTLFQDIMMKGKYIASL